MIPVDCLLAYAQHTERQRTLTKVMLGYVAPWQYVKLAAAERSGEGDVIISRSRQGAIPWLVECFFGLAW
jgi:hypothetical protein